MAPGSPDPVRVLFVQEDIAPRVLELLAGGLELAFEEPGAGALGGERLAVLRLELNHEAGGAQQEHSGRHGRCSPPLARGGLAGLGGDDDALEAHELGPVFLAAIAEHEDGT